MRIDIITIFPQLFDPFLTQGIVDKARSKGRLEVSLVDLRAFTEDRHRSVDDRPYGGGPGMLFRPEPVYRAMDVLGHGFGAGEPRAVPILLCPQGERLTQDALGTLATEEHLILLCGRYEGFDERIGQGFPWRRYSIGDYVLAGGEIPALVFVEGLARLLPGVLGHEESAQRDSFSEWTGPEGFDHPHYTRPPRYRGREVPEILLSGDHGRIEEWRKRESAAASRRTRKADGPSEG